MDFDKDKPLILFPERYRHCSGVIYDLLLKGVTNLNIDEQYYILQNLDTKKMVAVSFNEFKRAVPLNLNNKTGQKYVFEKI